MSFYFCVGAWSGIRFEIDYLVGIRLYLGWISLGIVMFNLEGASTAAFNQLNYLLSENYLLANVIREKLPEEYDKLFPKVRTNTKVV